MVGGFLVIVAAVGSFAAYAGATASPDTVWLVASRPIEVGSRIDQGDLQSVAIELPEVMHRRVFNANGSEGLAGAIAVAPIAAGELIEASDVVRPPRGPGGALVAAEEISFSVSIDRAVAGTLQPGERVDVLATYPDGCTGAVVRRALLLGSRAEGEGLDTGGVILTLGLDRPDQSAAVADAMNSAKMVVVRTNASAEATPTGACKGPVATSEASSTATSEDDG
ncbi:MAG: SAF domain-containing protein [Egibacteraceae bacterium]